MLLHLQNSTFSNSFGCCSFETIVHATVYSLFVTYMCIHAKCIPHWSLNKNETDRENSYIDRDSVAYFDRGEGLKMSTEGVSF